MNFLLNEQKKYHFIKNEFSFQKKYVVSFQFNQKKYHFTKMNFLYKEIFLIIG